MARLTVVFALFAFIALAAAMGGGGGDWDCPGDYDNCAEQVNDGGCCRCASSTSGFAGSSCSAGAADGKCIVSCGDSCDKEVAQVNCDAECTIPSCNCGVFTLRGVDAVWDEDTSSNVYRAHWTVCNLCDKKVEQINIGGFNGFGATEFNGLLSAPPAVNHHYGRYEAADIPSGVTFQRVGKVGKNEEFKQGACRDLTVATTSAAIVQPGYGWLAQMYVEGGDSEKSLNCANGQRADGSFEVTPACLGSAAIDFTMCCDGRVRLATDPDCRQDCTLCYGACFDGGVEPVFGDDACPTCHECCDGSSVQDSAANCPVCCLNSEGVLAAVDSQAECYTKCCSDGGVFPFPDAQSDPCAQVTCTACSCDGAIYDSADDCQCCADADGVVRNVAQLVPGGSAGSSTTIQGETLCYYCDIHCNSMGLQECLDADLVVTARFDTTRNPDGTVTIRAVYSTNFVDNTWGPNAWNDDRAPYAPWDTLRDWKHVYGSDKISVSMKANDGSAPMQFEVDLIGGGPSLPSDQWRHPETGFQSGCIVKDKDYKFDGRISQGNEDDFVSCITSTEINCNSECGVAIAACGDGGSSPSEDEMNTICQDWINEEWFEWTVKESAFLSAGGFSHPVITNIHASPSKMGDSDCPVVVPQGPNGEDPAPCEDVDIVVGPVDDGTCFDECCDEPGVLFERGTKTCPNCCCGGIVQEAECTYLCCPGQDPIDTSVPGNEDALCDVSCCGGRTVQWGESCPGCCPSKNADGSEGPEISLDMSQSPCDAYGSVSECAAAECWFPPPPPPPAKECCHGSVEWDASLNGGAGGYPACPVCCCPDAQDAEGCNAGATENDAGQCLCTDGSDANAPGGVCSSIELERCCNGAVQTAGSCPACCCDGTVVSNAATCPQCCPDTDIVLPAGTCADLANCAECAEPEEPEVFLCCDGTAVLDVTLCPECPALCCDGETFALAADCPSCETFSFSCPSCSNTVLECAADPCTDEELAACPTPCCDGVCREAGECPWCCPDGTVVAGLTSNDQCLVDCCDGSRAVAAECPFCCPLEQGGAVLDPATQCGGECSASTHCADCPNDSPIASCERCGQNCEEQCRRTNSGLDFCCPDGGLYGPCSESQAAQVPGSVGGPDYTTPEGCRLDCTCAIVEGSCVAPPPPAGGGGCSSEQNDADCELCNLQPGCVFCPALDRCASTTACPAGNLVCKEGAVETVPPVCFKGCYGNGDCFNGTCICYDKGYIDQDHQFCAPLNSKSDANSIAIAVGAGGLAGILLLAAVIGGVFIIGTKAAFDAFSGSDAKVEMMENSPIFEESGKTQLAATYEAKTN